MSTSPQPPGWINWLIKRLSPESLGEEISGDLDELFYDDVDKKGTRRARFNYSLNGLGFLFKSFFWKRTNYSHANSKIMIGSYFKMARRSLIAYKSNTIINILGLVFGIAATAVILIVIRFEMSFDTFHSNGNRIYRIIRVSGEKLDEFRTGVSYPLAPALQEEVSGFSTITSIENAGGAYVDIIDDKGTTVTMFQEDAGIALAEQSFFTVFDFKHTPTKWLYGRQESALRDPNSVVLTASIARKFFGNEQRALGRTLRFQKEIDCKVTGVMDDLPPNTDFPFTMLVSYNTAHKATGREISNWYGVSDDNHVYVVLKPNVEPKEMESQIARVHAAHTPKDIHESRHYFLQSLRDLHYDTRPGLGTFAGRTISKETVLALSLIAAFLLLTACINYINLATAQSIVRSKEIGLRKVMGSNKKNLILQFLTETFVVVFVASIIGIVIAEIVLFKFQSLFNMKWVGYHFTEPVIILFLLAIISIVTVLAGLYPAMLISRFDPVTTMKSKFSNQKLSGFSFRKALVVVQFTVIQILVVGTYIVISQMNFFSNRDMGFNTEAIVNAGIPDRNPSKLSTLATQLGQEAFISEVSFSFSLPSGMSRNRNYQDIRKLGSKSQDDIVVFEYASIDPQFIDLYHIKILAGRNVIANDTSGNVMINQHLVKRLQLGTPQQAVGAQLEMSGKKVTVVGIIDDYYSNSLKSDVDAIVMVVDPGAYSVMSVKLDTRISEEALTEAIQKIEKHWKAAFPEYVFNYQFFDQNIAAFYAQEKKYSTMFQLFSIVFLVIGCLGLYGLITFVVNRKGKEVAIRKVLGASVSQILIMFSKEYVQLIMISFVIAVPIAWYAVDGWLNNFAERIPLRWWLFLIPGLLVLLLSITVVVIKSMRTANSNPVDSLKYE